MNRSSRLLYRCFAWLMAVAVLATAVWTTQAAVELITFTAVGLPNGVRLSWQTATEQSAYGFLLQRSQAGGDPIDLTELYNADGQPYPGGLIEAEGSPTMGALYIADDRTAVSGQTYTYYLFEIEGNNQLKLLESQTVVAGGAAEPTPITINHTPTAVPQTATPNVTNTAVATQTSSPITPSATVRQNTAVPTTPAPSQATSTNQPLPTHTATAVPPQPTTPRPTNLPNNSGVAMAQTLDTPESPYPAPDDAPQQENPYPGQFVTPAPENYPNWMETPISLDDDAAYPGSAFTLKQETPGALSVVGHNAEQLPQTTAVPSVNSAASTFVLWLGFGLGSLTFVGATLVCISVFARRNR